MPDFPPTDAEHAAFLAYADTLIARLDACEARLADIAAMLDRVKRREPEERAA